MTFVVIALVVAILVRSSAIGRWFVIAVVFCCAVTVVVLMKMSWTEYRVDLRVGAAQGRYFFVFIGAISVIIAVGLGVVLKSHSRWAPRIALAVVFISNALAASDVIGTYWWPRDGASNPGWKALQNILYISPASRWMVIVLIVLTTALAAFLCAVVWVLTREDGGRGRRRHRRNVLLAVV